MLTIASSDGKEGLRPQSDLLRAPSVLVAEDDADVRRMVVEALRAAGYQVSEVRTGVELLDRLGDALLSGEPTKLPEVIVSDIRLPGLFGLGVLECLRAEHWRTGIIVMTAYADRETRDRVAKLGPAVAFLEKPFEVDDLLGAMRRLNIGSGAG